MKKILSFILSVVFSLSTNAQIGYQVALLNHANGEPRKNETVSVKVEITNSSNDVIYSQTQSATTNDFGLISLTIGNADTFKNVDWSKLPLYVSATVDDVLVGKTQILSVPVAEYAKKADTAECVKGVPTLEELIGKWRYYLKYSDTVREYILYINSDGTYEYTINDGYNNYTTTESGVYYYTGSGVLGLREYSYSKEGVYLGLDDELDYTYNIIKISENEIGLGDGEGVLENSILTKVTK